MWCLKICLAGMGLAIAPLGVVYGQTIDVLMKTEVGEITIALYPRAAPKTVANFLRYVDGGHYRGGTFYRVVRFDNQAQNAIKIEVVQGGLEFTKGASALAPIPHETTRETQLLHREGVISMARLEPGTATSEFFICVNAQPELDFGGRRNPDGMGFAAFGKVIKGMDLVRQIQRGKTLVEYTSGQMLLKPIVIENIERL